MLDNSFCVPLCVCVCVCCCVHRFTASPEALRCPRRDWAVFPGSPQHDGPHQGAAEKVTSLTIVLFLSSRSKTDFPRAWDRHTEYHLLHNSKEIPSHFKIKWLNLASVTLNNTGCCSADGLHGDVRERCLHYRWLYSCFSHFLFPNNYCQLDYALPHPPSPPPPNDFHCSSEWSAAHCSPLRYTCWTLLLHPYVHFPHF